MGNTQGARRGLRNVPSVPEFPRLHQIVERPDRNSTTVQEFCFSSVLSDELNVPSAATSHRPNHTIFQFSTVRFSVG